MKQYPYFLFIKTTSESTQDDKGNWSSGSKNWSFHSICREQTNGKGSAVNSQDGKAIVFSSVIHLPLNSARIKEGTEVLISETNTSVGASRISGQVLKYDAGQIHNRLWL